MEARVIFGAADEADSRRLQRLPAQLLYTHLGA
eukprot:CAMPEP_0185333234 /NCGR_PEP_ID=MMETSP1363-20130426/82965_1 /TAXON_ID=38817 /ORGANISM="Gephyrocapsa oceanica, Strain RCC1303" /LENGTH=32 /DNA_ID= /DNA_START= /DNA_END= /DNA_ORIENTATION=